MNPDWKQVLADFNTTHPDLHAEIAAGAHEFLGTEVRLRALRAAGEPAHLDASRAPVKAFRVRAVLPLGLWLIALPCATQKPILEPEPDLVLVSIESATTNHVVPSSIALGRALLVKHMGLPQNRVRARRWQGLRLVAVDIQERHNHLQPLPFPLLPVQEWTSNIGSSKQPQPSPARAEATASSQPRTCPSLPGSAFRMPSRPTAPLWAAPGATS